jgi:twitching motility two-component system response regulator PilH
MMIKNILIVDDSKTEQIHLSEMLTAEGYVTQAASDTTEAENLLSSWRPDLILLDVVMPGQNGFQFARQLSRDPRFSDTPIILCTSKNQETDRVWGLRQGAKAYLVKPVQKKELLDQIKSIFSKA